MEKEGFEIMRESINEMIKQVIDVCFPWLTEGTDGNVRFVDPLDGEEITAHYGATHAVVSFIIYGEKNENKDLVSSGYNLLNSIMKRWKNSMKLPGFHNDFNNFALCVLWNYFYETNQKEDYAKKIKEIVLSTPDSNNPTVNWFPMRWYVNLLRYRWTNDAKYKEAFEKCKTDINAATYDDGFIDDRLPVGLSFNLQYDVATVAGMQFLRSAGENIDISTNLGALINAVAPDGDINYLGRGTNQIFAWGLWVYLLASTGQEAQLEKTVNYLKEKVPVMLENNNMMLNTWRGKEKYMWWDYHYCSVYTAHLLLWLILAVEQMGKYPVQEKILPCGKSGVKIYKTESYFIATFTGRNEYLAEKGPCIAALWTRNRGMLVKGIFGPWLGAFGNKYLIVDATLRNYIGLIEVKQNKDYSKNKFFHTLLPKIQSRVAETISPIFVPLTFKETESFIELTWKNNRKIDAMFVIPALYEIDEMHIEVDGRKYELCKNMAIRNQYKWIWEYQSKIINGYKWTLKIPK